MNPNVVISNTGGLSTHGNDLSAEPGSTAVADNVTFSRERLPERRNGFKDFSSNLPDFTPEQLLVGSNGSDPYLFLDNGWWYFNGSSWLRKRGAFGCKIKNPFYCALVSSDLYVTSYNDAVVYKIDLGTGSRSIFAGRFGVVGSADGAGVAARFDGPIGICSDGENLFVCDAKTASGGNTIRKIVISTATVSTLAGTAGATGGSDGTGAAASFNHPNGITTDGTNLYLCEDSGPCVRQIVIASAVVTTLASLPAVGYGIVYSSPDLYVACVGDHVIRKVTTGGTVSVFAGTAGAANTTDGVGSVARFNAPGGICSDETNLYVADSLNGTIRKIVLSSASVTTLLGTGGSSGSADGIGSAARFNEPYGVVFDGENLLVADYANHNIRKIYLDNLYAATICGNSLSSSIAVGLTADGVFTGPE